METKILRTKEGFYFNYSQSDVREDYVLGYPVGGGFVFHIPHGQIVEMDAKIPKRRVKKE